MTIRPGRVRPRSLTRRHHVLPVESHGSHTDPPIGHLRRQPPPGQSGRRLALRPSGVRGLLCTTFELETLQVSYHVRLDDSGQKPFEATLWPGPTVLAIARPVGGRRRCRHRPVGIRVESARRRRRSQRQDRKARRRGEGRGTGIGRLPESHGFGRLGQGELLDQSRSGVMRRTRVISLPREFERQSAQEDRHAQTPPRSQHAPAVGDGVARCLRESRTMLDSGGV